MRLGFVDEIALSEKRALRDRPSLSLDRASIRSFPAAFEAYFNDHMGFRSSLTFLRNYIWVFWLKTSPVDDVILGKDGWLFFGAQEELDVYRRVPVFTPFTREHLGKYMRTVKAWLSQRDIDFLVVVAPNKSTVYPEYMPSSLKRRDAPSVTDEFVQLCRDADVDILDLRPAFLAAKDKGAVYYQSDSHWNGEGAALASTAIAGRLRAYHANTLSLPGAENWTVEKFDRVGDLCKLLGLGSVLGVEARRIRMPGLAKAREIRPQDRKIKGRRRFTTDNAASPKLLLYGDSFAQTLIPYLAPLSQTLEVVSSRRVDPSDVAAMMPDVVMLQVVERRLAEARSGLGDLGFFTSRAYGVTSATDCHRVTGRNEEDPTAWFGGVRQASEVLDSPGMMLFGRYRDLEAGAYQAVFRMKLSGDDDRPVVKLQVAANKGRVILAEEKVVPHQRDGSGPFERYVLDFAVETGSVKAVECRAEFLGGGIVTIESFYIGEPGKKTGLSYIDGE
jgi:hypothetical protein